jgi:hypothetical protein
VDRSAGRCEDRADRARRNGWRMPQHGLRAFGYHAGIAMRNALLRWPARVDYRSLPWVTHTDPELARTIVGARAGEMIHTWVLAIEQRPSPSSTSRWRASRTRACLQVRGPGARFARCCGCRDGGCVTGAANRGDGSDIVAVLECTFQRRLVCPCARPGRACNIAAEHRTQTGASRPPHLSELRELPINLSCGPIPRA